MPKEFFDYEGLSAEVREKVQNAAEALEQRGANVKEVSLPYNEFAIAAYYIIAPAEASSNLARFDGIRYGRREVAEAAGRLLETYRLSRGKNFGEEVKRRIILGTYVLSSGYYDAYYLRAQKARTKLREDFARVFEECDVLLTPTTPSGAFRMKQVTEPLQMYRSDIFTISANLAGIPGISVPCGFTETEGLPVGAQFLAPHFAEKEMLRVAAAYEQASPAAGCYPDVTETDG